MRGRRTGRLAAGVLACGLFVGCASSGPVVAKAPPSARRDDPGTKPGSGFFWVDGNWAWDEDKQDYHWRPGRWERFREGWYLAPGAWTRVEGGWQWQEEHWKQGPH